MIGYTALGMGLMLVMILVANHFYTVETCSHEYNACPHVKLHLTEYQEKVEDPFIKEHGTPYHLCMERKLIKIDENYWFKKAMELDRRLRSANIELIMMKRPVQVPRRINSQEDHTVDSPAMETVQKVQERIITNLRNEIKNVTMKLMEKGEEYGRLNKLKEEGDRYLYDVDATKTVVIKKLIDGRFEVRKVGHITGAVLKSPMKTSKLAMKILQEKGRPKPL